jgi:hypothetical protein
LSVCLLHWITPVPSPVSRRKLAFIVVFIIHRPSAQACHLASARVDSTFIIVRDAEGPSLVLAPRELPDIEPSNLRESDNGQQKLN